MINSIDSKEQDNDELFRFDSKNISGLQLSSMLPAIEVQSKVITPAEYKFVLEEIKLLPNFIDSKIKRSIIQSSTQFIQVDYIPNCRNDQFTEMLNEYSPQWFASLNSQLINVFATNSECDNVETFDSIGYLANVQTINIHIKNPNQNQQDNVNNSKLLAKLKELRNLCYKWRKVKGDGNCYYRAVMFSYIENLILMNNVKDLMALIYDMHCRFKENHFQNILANNKIESRNVMICIILVYLALINPTKNKDPIFMSYEIFIKCFNNIMQFDNGIVLYLRYLYYTYLKNNEKKLYTKDFCVLLGNLLPAEYETNEGQFLFDKFYSDFLLKLYKDAEKIIIYLTPYILDINLNILMFEEASNTLQGLKFLHTTKEGTYQNIVTILYRKSHYDLAYNETFVRKFYQYLSIFKMENDELTEFNDSVYVTNKREILKQKSMEYNAQNASFSKHLNPGVKADAVSIYEGVIEGNVHSSQDKESKENDKFLKKGIIMNTSDMNQSIKSDKKLPLNQYINLKQKENLDLNQSLKKLNNNNFNKESKDNKQINNNVDDQADNNDESDNEIVENAKFADDFEEETLKIDSINKKPNINNNHLKPADLNVKASMSNLNNQQNNTGKLNKDINDIANEQKQASNTENIDPLSTPKVNTPNRFLNKQGPITIKGKVKNTNSVLNRLKNKKDINVNQPNNQPIIPNPNLIERQPSPVKTPKKPQKPKPKLFQSTQLPTIKEQEEIMAEKKNLVKKTDNFDANEIKAIIETKEKKETAKIIFPTFAEIKIEKKENEVKNITNNNKSNNSSDHTSVDTTTPRQLLQMGTLSTKDVRCRYCKIIIFKTNKFSFCNDCLYKELLEKMRNEYKTFIKQSAIESITFSQYINHKSITIAQVHTFPDEVISILNMQKAKKTDLKKLMIDLIETRTCVMCNFFSLDKPLTISLPCKCHLCSQFCLSSYIQLIILKKSCDFVCLCKEVYDSNKEKGIFKLLEQYEIENYKKELMKKIWNRSLCMNGCGKNRTNDQEVNWIKLELQNENENTTLRHFMCLNCREKTKNNKRHNCSICGTAHLELSNLIHEKKPFNNLNDCTIF